MAVEHVNVNVSLPALIEIFAVHAKHCVAVRHICLIIPPNL